MWHLDRVERAEANPEFEKHFLRNLGKRVHADAVWVDEILDRVREFQRVRRDLFPPLEASELDRAIAAAARVLQGARDMGFRTPHGC